MSTINIHIGMFTTVPILCMILLICAISWSLFSVWWCHESQSTIYRSGPGLYSTCMLYWWMHSMMCCSPCDRVAVSLLTITTNGSWFMIMYTSLAKLYWWNCSNPCSMPRASHYMLLYLLLCCISFCLWKPWGTVLCCLESHITHSICHSKCNRLVPRSTLEVSVFRYKGFDSS